MQKSTRNSKIENNSVNLADFGGAPSVRLVAKGIGAVLGLLLLAITHGVIVGIATYALRRADAIEWSLSLVELALVGLALSLYRLIGNAIGGAGGRSK